MSLELDVVVAAAIHILARAVIEDGPGAFKQLWKLLRESVPMPGERTELLSTLFLGSGQFLFHPGVDWDPAPDQPEAPRYPVGYPHEIEALRAFTPLLPKNSRPTEQLLFPGKLLATDHLVCTGSPKANLQSRMYLPSIARTSEGDEQRYPTFLDPQAVEYWFGEALDPALPRVKVFSMMRQRWDDGKTRKFIWRPKARSADKYWMPKGYEPKGLDEVEELRKDFLLVSRLPRSASGGDILVFAGGHGAGTEAVKLLVNDMPYRALRQLVDLLEGKPYYQFVIEVTKVDNTTKGTVPRRIKISEELPPVILKDLSPNALCPEAKVWL